MLPPHPYSMVGQQSEHEHPFCRLITIERVAAGDIGTVLLVWADLVTYSAPSWYAAANPEHTEISWISTRHARRLSRKNDALSIVHDPAKFVRFLPLAIDHRG
jgi:hypothetical protein